MTYQLLKREELGKAAAVTQQMTELRNVRLANRVHVRTGKNPGRAADGL